MAQQAARREGALGEITTLLGRGSSFEGKLTFEGTVRVDGKFKGEVFSDDVLVVGEGAYLEAEVDIGEIIIQGSVVGNIRAKRSIEIHAPGRVKGDIHTPSLQIDKGVMFEGRSFMDGAVPGPAKPAGSPAGGTGSGGGGGGGGSGGMGPRPAEAVKPTGPAGPTGPTPVGPQPVK